MCNRHLAMCVVLHGGALFWGHSNILIDRTFKRVALMEACLKNDETIRRFMPSVQLMHRYLLYLYTALRR